MSKEDDLLDILTHAKKTSDEYFRSVGTLVSKSKYKQLTKDCYICKGNKERAKQKTFGFQICPDHIYISIEEE